MAHSCSVVWLLRGLDRLAVPTAVDGRGGFGLGNCAAIVLGACGHSRATDQVALGECGLSVPLFKPVDPIWMVSAIRI